MSNHRVKHYLMTTIDNTTGERRTELIDFTQKDADSVFTVLETDGIDIEQAKALCKMWIKIGNLKEVKCSYSIPFVKTKPS